MSLRVKANDVLDVNARVQRTFLGRKLGYFRRTGPNKWDDYAFVADGGEMIEVLPGTEIYLEPSALVFRMRVQGRVVRLTFEPTDEERRETEALQGGGRRAYFHEKYLAEHQQEQGIGETAFIAKKLNEA
jgi:hypothetical protein